MDFLDRALDYIENQADLPSYIRVGKLEEKPKSIVARPTPASAISHSLDSSKTREYSFQVLVKDPSAAEAIRIINKISEVLDGLPNGAIKSNDGSFIFISCETYVYPNWVETNDHGEHIYTALFTAEIEGGKQ